MTELKLAGKKSIYMENGPDGPVFLWCASSENFADVDILFKMICELLNGENFALFAVLSENWNHDYSPWPASCVIYENESFSGGGPDMLSWMQKEAVPYLQEHHAKHQEKYMLGYSLAGLFTLWSAFETECFQGFACCSGSLWFPEWDSYLASHGIAAPCSIYLSLGGKESKTQNRIMASIDEKTINQKKELENEALVHSLILEWNAGGHFSNPLKRIAKGAAWLFRHS